MSKSFQLPELQHARPLHPPLSPGACLNSWPLSWRCHPTISSSATPFSSCSQSFPASGSFPTSQLFASGSQFRSFSFSISPSNGFSGLISFRINWFDLAYFPPCFRLLWKPSSDCLQFVWIPRCASPDHMSTNVYTRYRIQVNWCHNLFSSGCKNGFALKVCFWEQFSLCKGKRTDSLRLKTPMCLVLLLTCVCMWDTGGGHKPISMQLAIPISKEI